MAVVVALRLRSTFSEHHTSRERQLDRSADPDEKREYKHGCEVNDCARLEIRDVGCGMWDDENHSGT